MRVRLEIGMSRGGRRQRGGQDETGMGGGWKQAAVDRVESSA